MNFNSGRPDETFEWCVVACPDYTPSGYRIAKWTGKIWEDDEDFDITKYVTGWRYIDL